MKTIILDRDGVINHDSEDYIKSPEEWIPIPGSLEAIADLNTCGFQVAVATNQSGIGRGFYDRAMLNAIHDKMQSALAAVNGQVEVIAFCPHHPDDRCFCRKPKPGLLYQLQQQLRFNFSEAILVGDSLKDLQVAAAVNMSAVLVESGIHDVVLPLEYCMTPRYKDLRTFVDQLLCDED